MLQFDIAEILWLASEMTYSEDRLTDPLHIYRAFILRKEFNVR
jgi:hypothetical protein